MSAKNIAIAYCADNEQVVKQIEQHLNLSGYQFQHYAGTKSTVNPPLSDQLLNQPNPILLIVSDNFLKAAQCMHRGLKLLQEKRNLILPVVIEGVTEDEQTGKTIKVQTDFERVSDIIQYINYWQDQYLDLRRQKRQMKEFDEEAFNAHLKIMREISSEAGEFLRVLRGMNYQTHESLVANSYEQFFKFTGDMDGWGRFKSKAPSVLITEPAAAAPEEEAPAEEVPAAVEAQEEITEAQEESPATPVEAEEERPPAGLSDIPGLDLIEERKPEERVEEPQTPAAEEPASDEIADVIEWGVGEAEVEGEAEAEVEVEGEDEDEGEEDENAGEPFYLDDEEDDALTEEEEQEEELEEDQVAVLVEEAMEYFNTGQVQEGLAFMAQAVEENPDSAYLKYNQALMLAQRGQDYRSARKALQSVVEAEPSNEEALYLMGELNELLEDFDNARKYYL
ncbi:MAG: hypothetical protein KDD28_34930, partial [Phaeodactylibacter sp.]|nr:hypothetical protein [Phaeodactylibacter sp.]